MDKESLRRKKSFWGKKKVNIVHSWAMHTSRRHQGGVHKQTPKQKALYVHAGVHRCEHTNASPRET